MKNHGETSHGNTMKKFSTVNKNKKEKTSHGKKLSMEKSRNDQSGASLFTSN
jgi:hypothetical protein